MKFEIIPFHREVNEEQWQLLQRGAMPQSMEEKWIIFFRNDILNFNRGGYTIFCLVPKTIGSKIFFEELFCRRMIEPNYKPPSKDREAKTVMSLIDLRLRHAIDEPWFGWDERYPKDTRHLKPDFSSLVSK